MILSQMKEHRQFDGKENQKREKKLFFLKIIAMFIICKHKRNEIKNQVNKIKWTIFK